MGLSHQLAASECGYQIGDLLKGEEGDRQGQQEGRRSEVEAEQRNERSDSKTGILKDSQEKEVGDDSANK